MRIAVLAAYPLHILPGFESLPAPGSHSTWLPQLAESWREQSEFQFEWITVSPGASRRRLIKCHSQNFHLLPSPKRLRTAQGFSHEIRAIQCALDELKPDLVHAWGTEHCYGLAAMRAGRPFLLSMQGILGYLVRHVQMHPRWFLQAYFEWRVLRKAKYLTVESRWGAEILHGLAPHAQVWEIEYGVNPLFHQVQWNPSPTRPIAIFVGATVKRKGLKDAVTAFNDPRLSNFELWVVGDANSRLGNELRKRSSAQVKWLGAQSAEATAQLMSVAWCLVLPTQGDTSPNVVKEARVIGLPVITTKYGGQRDYIDDGRDGFIVEPGRVNELVEKLNVVLSSLETTRSMGSYRHGEHRTVFHPENTSSSFLALYRELINRKHYTTCDQP